MYPPRHAVYVGDDAEARGDRVRVIHYDWLDGAYEVEHGSRVRCYYPHELLFENDRNLPFSVGGIA